MKYYLIAGEASGDTHGANLIKGLAAADPTAEFRFWGGDRMAAAAGRTNLVKHYRETSFFGVFEVLRNLRKVFSQLDECRRDIEAFAPDVVILIDYPGFNMRIARFAWRRHMKVFYYISPKVWAWKERRVEQIRKYVDRLFIILPFEREYFAAKGIDAIYEGNPSVDDIAERLAAVPDRDVFMHDNGLSIDDTRPLVALLAGSRRSEIQHNLPFMVRLAESMPDCRFAVAGVPWLDESLYRNIIAGSTNITLLIDQTCALVRHADAAVVTSGTATLETALIGTPEVVCYRTDPLTVWVGRSVLKIKYISLVNLIMDRATVTELIQNDMSTERAESELRAILPGGSRRQRMLDDYRELHDRVGGTGTSARVAARMVEELLKK